MNAKRSELLDTYCLVKTGEEKLLIRDRLLFAGEPRTRVPGEKDGASEQYTSSGISDAGKEVRGTDLKIPQGRDAELSEQSEPAPSVG